MKIISIGRGEECNIVLDDPMISRRHAVLRLYPTGKIEIIDYSTNGTSINGVKLARETLTNIKRGTPVSFAGVKTLDWKEVPDPSKPYRMIAFGIIGFIILIFAAWGIKALINAADNGGETMPATEYTTTNPNDTLKQKPTAPAEEYKYDPEDTKLPAGAIPTPPPAKAGDKSVKGKPQTQNKPAENKQTKSTPGDKKETEKAPPTQQNDNSGGTGKKIRGM